MLKYVYLNKSTIKNYYMEKEQIFDSLVKAVGEENLILSKLPNILKYLYFKKGELKNIKFTKSEGHFEDIEKLCESRGIVIDIDNLKCQRRLTKLFNKSIKNNKLKIKYV